MNWKHISRLLLVVLLASSLGCGIYATANAVQRIKVVHQIDYEEGNILNAGQRINHGLSPYPDPQGWPVVINPYGPLPYYLTAITVHFFGPHFAPARALILIATVLCVIFIGLLIQHFTRSPIVAVAFGALFVSQTLIQYWMAILRVDIIGLVLTLAGLYVFVRFPRLWALSVVLLSLSVFTKFSFLAAPTTCFVYLVIQKQRRRAVQFTVAMSAMLLLLFGSAQILTHGAFAYDVLLSHVDPMIWSHYVTFYEFVFGTNPLLTLIGLGALIWAITRREFSFPVLYLIFAIIGTASVGKMGSNLNHMSELVAALCIIDGVLVAQLLERTRGLAITASTACALLGIWMFFQIPYVPTATPFPGCVRYYDLIGRYAGDRILAEDVGSLVVNNKTVWVSNPFVYAQLAQAGKTPDTQLQQHLRDKWFDLVILRDDPHSPSERWSPAARAALLDNYDLAGQVLCMDASLVYVPKHNAPH
jgi:hypothetical protein